MRNALRLWFHRWIARFPRTGQRILTQDFAAGVLQTNQQLLRLRYQELARSGGPLPSFDAAQFRVLSQNGEDGILWLLFAVLGVTNKRAVEMCAGAGIECNAANLIVNHGWEGFLFDGDPTNVRLGREFFARCQDTRVEPPRMIQAWITAENVNALLSDAGVTGQVDLLSLDLDGVDYWIWKALDAVEPRVVVVEYNNLWGPDDAVTVPYSANFVAQSSADGPDYAGASLAAFVKLAREKGYRLVGAERHGFNAFFVRAGLGETWFPEVPVAACLQHPFVRRSQRERWPKVRDREWVRV